MIIMQLPEEDEPFTVTLTRPTNGAVLGENHNATIVINKNDDAIYFKGKFQVYNLMEHRRTHRHMHACTHVQAHAVCNFSIDHRTKYN